MLGLFNWIHFQRTRLGTSEVLFTIYVSLFFFLDPIKLALTIEAQAWKMLLGKSLNQEYRKKMDGVSDFVAEYTKRLARPIKDLDDVRNAMGALEDLRQNEIRIDMILGPIEVRLFNRFLNYSKNILKKKKIFLTSTKLVKVLEIN